MTAAGTVATQPISFPVEVTKTIVFLAKTQDDLIYLNNKEQDADFIQDVKDMASNIYLEIISVDGEKIQR